MGEILKDRLVVANDTKYLIRVRDFVGALIRRSYLSRVEENKIILAVDEAVSNIIEHGYDNGLEGNIEVEIEADEYQFKIMIRDSGKIFDPQEIKSPDMTEHVSLGRKRGLGIFIMRQVMDEVRYNFKKDVKNELTLVKYVT